MRALRAEGYDPRSLRDPIFVRHPEQDAYVRLTPELFDEIAAAKLRL